MSKPRYRLLGLIPDEVHHRIQRELDEAAQLQVATLKRIYEIKKGLAAANRRPALLSAQKPNSPIAQQGSGGESENPALVGTKP